MEDRLEEVAGWIRGGAREAMTWRMADDLDPSCKAALLDRIEAALALIGHAYREIGTPKEERSLLRFCNGALGLTWELPPDLRPERMRGFGEVPLELAPELADLARRLEGAVMDVERALAAALPGGKEGELP
ncbi:MAG: hypothetical protein JST05_03610 [Acidobacteria bacterium]|nr:hypothetical protein [Bacteroidota bacterium]MBS1766476.1 hypothetical protein [Acidobacteriota bacterium]